MGCMMYDVREEGEVEPMLGLAVCDTNGNENRCKSVMENSGPRCMP